MELKLDPLEARALLHALDGYLPVLEFTLSRVKHPRERHELVAEDEALTELRERLKKALSAAPATA